MIFPISKSCFKIIESVYTNNGVKISKLLREASVSQKIGYMHVQELINAGVLKEETVGSLRIIKPNLKNETGLLIYGLIEKEREFLLLEKKPTLKVSLTKVRNNAGKYGIDVIVLYGPFINKQDKESIDILVVSELDDKRVVPFLQECFNNIENAVSARIMTKEGFMRFKETKNDLYQALFSNHVCVYNSQNFLKLIA